MDSDREASCTPPLPMTEDLLPEQLSKFHSPLVAANEQGERKLSSPASKRAPDSLCTVAPGDGRKKCPDGSDRKTKEEGGKRAKKSDDSTPRRQSSKETPSNEKHTKTDGHIGGSSKAKGEKQKNASQERDNGKERHHRSRNHHRRKTRSRSKESTSLTKGSPGRTKNTSGEDGTSKQQRKENKRGNDEEKKKKSKSRRRSRSAEETGNNDERQRGHSRSHSRSRSRRESVRRERRSSSAARDSRSRRGDSFREGSVQRTGGSHFTRDFNFPGRRGFHQFQRGGRFQGFPRRGSPFWARPGPTRAPTATLSAMKYTKTLPTISWRDWTEQVEPNNAAVRSPVRKIRPITPAIAALQEYDGSEGEATSNSDGEEKRNAVHGEQDTKFHDAKVVQTPPVKVDGAEEQLVRHIKLERMDERDYTDEKTSGEIKFDCSIVKKEPLTEEDEESPREATKAAQVEEKVESPCPPVNLPAKPKFSCSFLDDLSSGALMLDPELLASPERQESGDEAPEADDQVGRARRGAGESPDTDDYAANWETEETLSTSPSKQNMDDASPKRGRGSGTPPTNHKPEQPEPPQPADAPNGSVELNGEEKRAHLKPRSMHEEIIPLDDLLNVQHQLKSYKSQLEEEEKLKATLRRTDGKSGGAPSEQSGRGGLFADKLADEYKNFMQSLAQTPAGEMGRERKRSSSTSSSSSSSSSSSDSSSDSSSSSASSSSSSSSSSDSEDRSSAEEDEEGSEEGKAKARGQDSDDAIPTELERTEGPAAGADEEKHKEAATPPHRPTLVIPEYLLPKVPTPPAGSGPPTQQTPTKIYSIRDDFVASDGTEGAKAPPTIKPLELDRDTPIKLKLPSKSRMLAVGGASALLDQDDEESALQPSGPAGELEQKPPKDRRRSSEDKSSRHRQKRSRDRHDRKQSASRNRSRDRQSSGATSPKRKSRDRDKRSSRKDRSSPSRKERSSQRHGSRSPRRRTRSPRGRRRSVSKSRSRSRSRYHSLSPSQRRPPSPRGGRSPVDHRRAGRSRRRYSVDREWNARRSRSPYGSRRPPSPKDAPPMAHGSENQIDIITSTGASPNVHSPVTGYKKSLADSTISDAELESQKRKLIGYGGGAYYGPLPTDGMHLDAGAVPGASATAEGGDESSPKRISLDDRINIVLGMNGTVDGAKSGGKHHHGHLHHHHHHHHAPYGEYPPSHDMYQQRSHHPASAGNYPLPGYGAGQDQYGGSPYGAYGSRGPPNSLAQNASVATPSPYYPGSGRGPPPSWAPRSHPYQGYPMAFVAPPHHRPLLPGEMYRFPFAPPTSVPPAGSAASEGGNSKSQVKQVGNVLEIVPSSAPLSAAGSDGAAGSTHLTPSASDGSSHPGVGVAANGSSSTTSPAEAATLGDPAQQQPSTGGSSALVTPKILTAEELQQRHDRRLELKKKIRAEREKKRLDKKQRKERLQQDIKRLLGPKATGASGGTTDPLLDGGAAGGAGMGVGGERGGSGGGGGSASSDEEFETIKQADLLASLSRSYEKSILKVAKPPNAAGSGATIKKSVLFADGMAPGDKSSSSADEAKEKSPNKQSAAKQRKKLRRQRTLKITGKKRLVDRLKLPELEQEPEEIDPELENLPPPPPPPGSPPPELQQPRCLNPPVVRMIDFREGFHGIGLPLPVPPVTMGGPPPPIHLVAANAMGPVGASSSIPLPVPPVSLSVQPGPVPAPVPSYRQPPTMAQPHHHHHLLPSHLATQRPTSPHGVLPPLHHTHPPPHLYHTHPPHIGHGSLHAPPPSAHHAYHQHHHHHPPPPQTALPPPNASSALITISSKKRTTANGSNSTGVSSIESIVSTVAAAPGPIVAGSPVTIGNSYDGTPPV